MNQFPYKMAIAGNRKIFAVIIFTIAGTLHLTLMQQLYPDANSEDSDSLKDMPVSYNSTFQKNDSQVSSATEVWNYPVPKPRFLEEYKNPCWKENVSQSTYIEDERNEMVEVLRCLPYYYLIGFTKCGTTDVYKRLIQHPDIFHSRKEFHWWSKMSYRSEFFGRPLLKYSYYTYVSNFDRAAQSIEGPGGAKLITGDASPSTIWFSDNWKSMSPNAGKEEPVFLTAHLVKQFTPDAKFIVMIRNPTERLYSDFNMRTEFFIHEAATLQQRFATIAAIAVRDFNKCLSKRSLKSCCYDEGVEPKYGHIKIGIYYQYLLDWFSVFPRNQFKVFRLEDYEQDKTKVLNEIYSFLGLDSLPIRLVDKIEDLHNHNVRKDKRIPMKNETRLMLDVFYHPFNKQLAELLNDERFLYS